MCSDSMDDELVVVMVFVPSNLLTSSSTLVSASGTRRSVDFSHENWL